MKLKSKISIILLLLLTVYPVSTKDTKDKMENAEFRELKDFAFCSCLYLEFKSDSVFNKDGTLNAITQLGLRGPDDYDSMIKFVENYLDTFKVSSYENHRLGIWKCMQLYYNKSLDSIIKNIVFPKKKTKNTK